MLRVEAGDMPLKSGDQTSAEHLASRAVQNKIPYLYHVTKASNVVDLLKSGELKSSKSDPTLGGRSGFGSGPLDSVFFSPRLDNSQKDAGDAVLIVTGHLLERGDYFGNKKWFYGTYDPYGSSLGWRMSYSAADIEENPELADQLSEIVVSGNVPLGSFGVVLVVPTSFRSGVEAQFANEGIRVNELPIKIVFRDTLPTKEELLLLHPKAQIAVKKGEPHPKVAGDQVAKILSISEAISKIKAGHLSDRDIENLAASVAYAQRYSIEIKNNPKLLFDFLECLAEMDGNRFLDVLKVTVKVLPNKRTELRTLVLKYINKGNRSFVLESFDAVNQAATRNFDGLVTGEELINSNLYRIKSAD
jgi:hypothetical protein